MKRDLAVRLAATEDEEVRVPQVRRIIATFLENLIVCSMCNGVGNFTFGADTPVKLRNPSRGLPATDATVEAGSTGKCPACAGTGCDPAYGEYRCFRQETSDVCKSSKNEGSDSLKSEHARCGFRALVPLDDEDDKD